MPIDIEEAWNGAGALVWEEESAWANTYQMRGDMFSFDPQNDAAR